MEIDRQKVCPMLLRCFWRTNRGNPISEYRQTANDVFPDQEVQIYTWRDATLSEIGDLIRDVVPEARENGSVLSLNLVFVDKKTPNYQYSMKLVSCICDFVCIFYVDNMIFLCN